MFHDVMANDIVKKKVTFEILNLQTWSWTLFTHFLLFDLKEKAQILLK